MSRSARSLWSEFAGSVIEPDAPPVQYTEMRLAFYAGLIAALSEHRPTSPTPSWERLWNEVSDFVQSDSRRLTVERAVGRKGK